MARSWWLAQQLLQPLAEELVRYAGDVGTVFRRYPGMWQVFVEDLEAPGRYKLIAERPSSPAGEGLPHLYF